MTSTTPAASFAAKSIAPRRGARMTEREKLQGRLEAARINGGATAVTSRGNDRYTVEGRAGARYTVQVFSLERMACDCKAGLHGAACYHAACVYLRLIAERTVAR